jgi:hypothetical protein
MQILILYGFQWKYSIAFRRYTLQRAAMNDDVVREYEKYIDLLMGQGFIP